MNGCACVPANLQIKTIKTSTETLIILLDLKMLGPTHMLKGLVCKIILFKITLPIVVEYSK